MRCQLFHEFGQLGVVVRPDRTGSLHVVSLGLVLTSDNVRSVGTGTNLELVDIKFQTRTSFGVSDDGSVCLMLRILSEAHVSMIYEHPMSPCRF